MVDARGRRTDGGLDLLRGQGRILSKQTSRNPGDDRRREGRPGPEVRLPAAVVIASGDRCAEDRLRRRQNFDTAAAASVPPGVVRGHAADRDDAVDLGPEDCGEAIDDAGSGYASLQSIAELRPNFLKISNTLVTGLHEDSIKRDVVEMLVRLAHRIDAQTVAEGIETEAEKAEIKGLGVTYGQGYLLGRPVRLG